MFQSRFLTRTRCHTIPLLFILSLFFWGCGDDDDSGGTTPVDTTRPTVTSVDPAHGAIDIDVDTQLTVGFSEDIDQDSITAESIRLYEVVLSPIESGKAAGTRSLTYTPNEDLEYGTTYEAVADSSLADMAGNTLAEDFVWSFRTGDPPLGAVDFPLAAGNSWLYDSVSSATVWTGTGSSTSEFDGLRSLYCEGEIFHESRDGWLIRDYSMDETVSTESALNVDYFYLSSDAHGLYRAAPARTAGAWHTLIEYGSAEFLDSGFLFAGGPVHSDGSDQMITTIDGPDGEIYANRIEHEFTQTGTYATEDIFETRREYYSDGLGLVSSFWDYDFDDNDPSGFDYDISGWAELLEPVNGSGAPFMTPEFEPNNHFDSGVAQDLTSFSIVTGDVQMSDAGTILLDEDVACIYSVCINEDITGVRIIEDFYLLDVDVEAQYRVDLVYDTADPENDLDLYFFELMGDDTLRFIARADASAGVPEWMILLNLTVGTYCVGIQAWNTPTDDYPVEYTVAVRPQAIPVQGARLAPGAEYVASAGK